MKTLSILAALLMAAPVVAEEQAQQAEEELVVVPVKNDAFLEECQANGNTVSVNYVVNSRDLNAMITEGDNAGKTYREVGKTSIEARGQEYVDQTEANIAADKALENPEFTEEDYSRARAAATELRDSFLAASSKLDSVVCVATVADAVDYVELTSYVRGLPEAEQEAAYTQLASRYFFNELSSTASVCTELATVAASQQIEVRYQYMCSDETGVVSLSQAAELRPLSEVEAEQEAEQVTP